MKRVSLVLLLVASLGAAAQSRRNQSTGQMGVKFQVLKLSNQVAKLTEKKIHILTRSQLRQLKIILEDAKIIIKGNSRGPRGSRQVVCSQDHVNIYQNTFIKAKAIAKNTLRLWTDESIQYATKWTQTYPCDYISDFDYKMKSLVSFAKNQLKLWSDDAIKYAKQNVDQMCMDQDYVQMFKSHHAFAKNQLGYWSDEAIKYAKSRVQGIMLSCPTHI